MANRQTGTEPYFIKLGDEVYELQNWGLAPRGAARPAGSAPAPEDADRRPVTVDDADGREAAP